MEFRVLGPLHADAGDGAGPVVIRQPLPQAALAVLLLRPNQACLSAWLIDALYGLEPPPDPEAALRTCISRLRRDLGGCAERLVTVGPPGGRTPGHRQPRGYEMVVGPGELDLEDFRDLVAQGRAELEMGNAPGAADALRQALALWGDRPLQDVPSTPPVDSIVAGLTDQFRAARDALVDARIAMGEHAQVLPELRTAVQAEPAREHVNFQLMTAYQALGRFPEALEVYSRAREAMLSEFGAEPGPALSMLQADILSSSSGAGFPASARFPPEQAQAVWQPPAPPGDFTGREREVGQVKRWLSGAHGVPVVVIAGGPGTGKTAAAAAAATQLRSRFPGGQLYAELGGVSDPRDPQDVLADLLHSLGVAPHSVPPAGPARSAMYRSMLDGRQVLVVADAAAFAGQVRPLIPASGAVLVTSRGRLADLEASRAVELGPLEHEDAIALLRSAAGDEQRIAADPAAAAAIITACGALPLALRLAGAVLADLPGLGVSHLAAELGAGRTLDWLACGGLSVREAVASSFAAVSAPARAAFAVAAAILPGQVPAWALADLAGGDTGVVRELRGVGLLAAGETAAGSYEVHALSRQFAAGQLPAFGLAETDIRRMRSGWIHRAAQAAASLPDLPDLPRPAAVDPAAADAVTPPVAEVDPAWLAREQANLAAVIRQACDAGEHEAAARLAAHTVRAQWISGNYAAALADWALIHAAAVGDTGAAARASYYLAATIVDSHGQLEEARRLLSDCVPYLEQAGDSVLAAFGRALLARAGSQDDAAAALAAAPPPGF